MANSESAFPAKLSIDYPDRPLDRLSSFFRIIFAIPILIVFWLLPGMYAFPASNSSCEHIAYYSTAYVFLPLVLMLLFRQKYPRWWYDWNVALIGFAYRVGSYLALLRDEYPSTDEEQAIHINIPYPDAKALNRWLPLVKWFLAIPHYIVLAFLIIGSIVCIVIAWFAILFTGRFPRGLFDYVVGVSRWCLRVSAYAFFLTTDQYPPFSLAD